MHEPKELTLILPSTEVLKPDALNDAYYSELVARISNSDPVKTKELVIKWINGNAATGTIDETDLEGMGFIENHPTVEELSNSLGIQIRRPIFTLPLPNFRKMMDRVSKVSKPRAGSTFKVLDPLDSFRETSDDEMRMASLIFLGQESTEFVRHEVLHTIDPYADSRPKEDRVIMAELAAMYGDRYLANVYNTVTTTYDPATNTEVSKSSVFTTHASLRYLRANLLASFEYYGRGFANEPAYKDRVIVTFDIIAKLEQHLTNIQVHKAILNSKSLEDLINLADCIEKEKT